MWKKDQRHILIVCALWKELQIVKSILKGQVFQWIQFHRHVCGVGIEQSMMSLTELFVRSEVQFDLVINIGIAGRTTPYPPWQGENKKGKVVQCLRIIQWDANKELCVPPQYIIPDVDIMPLTSRYRVVRDRSQMSTFLTTDPMITVDMEGYSIESVCDRWWYPRMYLKVLYDEIGVDSLQEYDEMLVVLHNSLAQLPDLLKKIL